MAKAGVIRCLVVLLFLALAGRPSLFQHLFPVLLKKYSHESDLKTATKNYANASSEVFEDVYEPCTANCPWDTYRSNEDFLASTNFRAEFRAEDDEKVKAMRAQLACVPFSFGYSRSQGERLFPPYFYPSCDSYPSDPRPTLHIANDSFEMSCDDGSPGRYVLHPAAISLTDHKYYSDVVGLFTPREFPGHPVPYPIGEFALGACSGNYTQAQLVPRFKPAAYQRALNIMQLKGKGNTVRPLTVLFIAVDSFSRKHFYRKMKETVSVLNTLNANQSFAAFDFKVHNVMGKNSPQNMVPMFGNQKFSWGKGKRKVDALGRESLWALAKDWGFVTFLGFEYCGSNFINSMGQRVSTDHFVNNFYCAVKAYMGVHMGTETAHQRCVGPYMSHYYLLNYTLEFSRLYRGVNQFMYMHVVAGHEDTGQHAQTLDRDLATFLANYTSRFGDKEDLAIFIQGDHGMRYGDWNVDENADQEYKLPALFLVASTALLDRIPNSYDTLWHNTFRLVSKRDFRATILSLFSEPFNIVNKVHNDKYLIQAYVLTREKVRDSRVCSNSNIEPWLCSCIEPNQGTGAINTTAPSALLSLLTYISTEALALLNSRTFTFPESPAGLLCQRLSLANITRASALKLSRKVEQLTVEIAVAESTSARVEVIAIVGSDATHELLQRADKSAPEAYTYLGFPVLVKVMRDADNGCPQEG